METGSSGQVQRVIQMPAGNASSGMGVIGTGVAGGPLASTLDSRGLGGAAQRWPPGPWPLASPARSLEGHLVRLLVVLEDVCGGREGEE